MLGLFRRMFKFARQLGQSQSNLVESSRVNSLAQSTWPLVKSTEAIRRESSSYRPAEYDIQTSTRFVLPVRLRGNQFGCHFSA